MKAKQNGCKFNPIKYLLMIRILKYYSCNNSSNRITDTKRIKRITLPNKQIKIQIQIH